MLQIAIVKINGFDESTHFLILFFFSHKFFDSIIEEFYLIIINNSNILKRWSRQCHGMF